MIDAAGPHWGDGEFIHDAAYVELYEMSKRLLSTAVHVVDPTCSDSLTDQLVAMMGPPLFEFTQHAQTGTLGFIYHARARWDYWYGEIRFRYPDDAVVFRLRMQ